MATAGLNNNDDSKSTSFNCSICLDKFAIPDKIPKVLPCGHSYCQMCLVKMIVQRQIECPQCRKVAVEPSGGFPTNYALMETLKNVDDETKETDGYKCSECAKVLAPTDAFLCRGCHDGIICIKCYAANHGAHDGLEHLQTILDINRPRLERARENLNEALRKFNSPETQVLRERHQAIGEKLTEAVHSMNESIADFFKISSDQTTMIEKMLASSSLESLTVSKTGMELLEKFSSSCFDEERFDRMLTNAKKKISFLEEMLQRAEATIDDECVGETEEQRATNRGNDGTSNAAASSTASSSIGTSEHQAAAAPASATLGTGKPTSSEVSVISKNQTAQNQPTASHHVEEFNVPNSVMDLVIGSIGTNIYRARNIPGVLSIQMDMQGVERPCLIKVHSANVDAAREARKMLEFNEEPYLVPKDIVGRIIGRKRKVLQAIIEYSGVVAINVDQERNASGQDVEPQNDHVPFIVIGIPDAINKAKHCLGANIEHFQAMGSFRDGLEREALEMNRQLYNNDTHGAYGGGWSSPPPYAAAVHNDDYDTVYEGRDRFVQGMSHEEAFRAEARREEEARRAYGGFRGGRSRGRGNYGRGYGGDQ